MRISKFSMKTDKLKSLFGVSFRFLFIFLIGVCVYNFLGIDSIRNTPLSNLTLKDIGTALFCCYVGFWLFKWALSESLDKDENYRYWSSFGGLFIVIFLILIGIAYYFETRPNELTNTYSSTSSYVATPTDTPIPTPTEFPSKYGYWTSEDESSYMYRCSANTRVSFNRCLCYMRESEARKIEYKINPNNVPDSVISEITDACYQY